MPGISSALSWDNRPLSIYLNDHLTGSAGGTELIRRAAAGAYPEHQAELTALADEIVEDQASLVRIMRELDVPARHYRIAAGWAAEKAGRLKLNGHVLSRSPLSHLVEVEAMLIGVRGKAAGWRSLLALSANDSRLSSAELEQLIARADHQSERLERIRLDLAVRVLEP